MLSLSLTPPTLPLPCDALASDLTEKGEAERMGTHPILCTCAHVPSFPSLRSGPAPLSCWTPCPLLPRIPSFLHPPNSFLSCQSLLFFSFVLIRRVNIFFPLQFPIIGIRASSWMPYWKRPSRNKKVFWSRFTTIASGETTYACLLTTCFISKRKRIMWPFFLFVTGN